jgi:hypothetical protein
VGVVLLNWNGGEFTVPCVRSLLAGSTVPQRVVVVDNASEDGSPERIAALFPEVTLLRNVRNEGFAGGNNQGLALLLREEMDWIWLLNNDTVVAPDCLAQLVAVAQRHPHAAGLSARIYYDAPRDRLWYAGAVRHPWHRAPAHLLTPALDAQAAMGAVAVPFISGCCMFVPAWAWRRYGGLIAAYIAYSEDSEWCWRVSDDGGQLLYVPAAVLWHRLSASVRKNTATEQSAELTPRAWHLMMRNHLWTVRRHTRPPARWGYLAVNAVVQMRALLRYLRRGDRERVAAAWRGLGEGLFAPLPADAPRWD